MRSAFFFLGSVASIVVACGGAEGSNLFDGGVTGDDGGTTNDVAQVDTGNDCEPTCVTIPQGFHAARMAGAKTVCPSGWNSVDAVTDPVAATDACSCACDITQQPDCNTKGSVTRSYDDFTSATCNTQGTSFPVTMSGCATFGGSIVFTHDHYEVTSPEPSGGTCTWDAKLDAQKVTSTAARVCVPPSSCVGAICDGGDVCIAADGDVACPGTFPTKTLVGASASAQCAACAGLCAVGGACTGTLSFFTDTACTTGELDFSADGTCKANTPSATQYSSYSYKGTLGKSACIGNAPTTTAAAATLDQPATICCK